MTRLATSRGQLSAALSDARRSSATVALVPTLGALHDGHAQLFREGRGRADVVVVSVFVNPLQFGPGEDYARYPRTLAADVDLATAEQVDVVFAPDVDEVFAGGAPEVGVDPGPRGSRLEGLSRPGHFGGVLTVVAALVGLVRPAIAVFGEKDYQQLVLVRAMVRDLAMGVDVVGVETVRDADGLALSSRNAYLDAEQRGRALALARALRAGSVAAGRGSAEALSAARSVLESTDGIDVDYLELTGPDLGPPPGTGPARLLVAARVGPTRLIDNAPVVLGATNAATEGSA